MLQRPIIIILLSLCCAVPPAFAAGDTASWLGAAELTYGEHWAEDDSVRVLDASHFTQQYSLGYRRKGTIAEGRGGRYDLMLGYEWNSLASDFNNVETDIDTGKILYRGDVRFEPGGLPFRIHLFSEDIHKSSFLETNVDTIFTASPSDSFRLEGPITNIINGQHIRSGITLVVGIRNGHYQGRYRDTLSNFPRLLIDYEQIDVRDMKSATPQHYRDRNLAFVSLNKKDNWFHYRLFQHRNYLMPSEDFDEQRYLIGTVDHTNRRQWINLTNWIKISADGGYLSGQNLRNTQDATERYDLNLFAATSRADWRATSFNTFSRTVELGRLRKTLEVPFFAQGEASKDTGWRFRFVGRQDHEMQISTGLERDEDILFASSRVDLFRQGRVILAPFVEAEAKGGDYGEGSAARIGFETFTNRKYNPKYDCFGSYSLTRFEGTGLTGLDTDFWEQQAKGRVETRIGRSVTAGAEQEFVYGTGTLDREVSNYIIPVSDTGLTLSTVGTKLIDGEVFRSISKVYGEHVMPRLRNRFEIIYDYLSDPVKTEGQVILEHRLRYDQRAFLADMRSRVVIGGDVIGGGQFGDGVLGLGDSGQNADTVFEHVTSLGYMPTRALDARLRLNYDWRDGPAGSSSHWMGIQDFGYSFFTVNGVVRKVAEITEKFEYERFTAMEGSTQTATVLTLGGNYYPTRVYYVGGRVRYDLRSPEDTAALTWFAETGANFQKLQVSLDYAYGTRTAGVTLPDRVEQRWEVKVKKIF
jgi:hypothetical protein